jgi:hypothetical protein
VPSANAAGGLFRSTGAALLITSTIDVVHSRTTSMSIPSTLYVIYDLIPSLKGQSCSLESVVLFQQIL